MRILHYALGFPPYRSGGMTKFNIDLMIQQSKKGHQVALLWPGRMRLINQHVSILDCGLIKSSCNEIFIQSYEIVNPLPIPFDEGINKFELFMKNVDTKVYRKLFDDFKPDVIHMHTLMGIHKSFLSIAKDRNIRIVFSAHDFFPICPKVTMFSQGEICSSVISCENCSQCNSTALSMKKIKILQTPIYRKLKDIAIIKKIRQEHRKQYLAGIQRNGKSRNTSLEYKKLRSYYFSLLKMMDIIHFNSSVTQMIHEQYFGKHTCTVINISHLNIVDNRIKKTFSDKKIKIRYMGSQSGGKGFYLLVSALDKLWLEKQNFCLDIHFNLNEKKPYMNIHDRYSYNELKNIFLNTDVLIVPSVWYETFGFTVLEAICHGVPVIISDTVGAKDILREGSGIIIEDISADKLYLVIKNLTSEKLERMNNIINEKQEILTMEMVEEKIFRECYNI